MVEGPSTNKGWHGEFIFVNGGDLGYLPEYRNPDGVTGAVRRIERLEAEEWDEAIRFAGGKTEGLWTKNDFLKIPFLISHNCKSVNLFVLFFICFLYYKLICNLFLLYFHILSCF